MAPRVLHGWGGVKLGQATEVVKRFQHFRRGPPLTGARAGTLENIGLLYTCLLRLKRLK